MVIAGAPVNPALASAAALTPAIAPQPELLRRETVGYGLRPNILKRDILIRRPEQAVLRIILPDDGDRRATRARTSHPGTRFLRNVENESALPGANPAQGITEQTIRIDPKELSAFAEVGPADAQDAVATFYHKWDSTRSRVESADPASGMLKVRGPAQKANTAFDHHTGIVIENLLSLLDEPGEWFLSRSGRLTYQPRAGEDVARLRGVTPIAEKLLTFTGKPGDKVRHHPLPSMRSPPPPTCRAPPGANAQRWM
mgnify:CR=1 FL=1